jgi:hypothetical protein
MNSPRWGEVSRSSVRKRAAQTQFSETESDVQKFQICQIIPQTASERGHDNDTSDTPTAKIEVSQRSYRKQYDTRVALTSNRPGRGRLRTWDRENLDHKMRDHHANR